MEEKTSGEIEARQEASNTEKIRAKKKLKSEFKLHSRHEWNDCKSSNNENDASESKSGWERNKKAAWCKMKAKVLILIVE